MLVSSHVLTILIIDDDSSMRDYLSILLSDKATIITAKSGIEGIAVATEIQPDLILLDVSMDGMDGFEVCKRLKSVSTTSSIPVLFVTADDDEEAEVRALELGAVDFITKPIRPIIVRARIETHIVLRKHILMMEKLVHIDGLTQLFNRRYFDSQLNAEVARHRRQHQSLVVALIDVDHFKRFNDNYGHPAGDDCLQKVAHSLQQFARRPGEVVARFGGEEFVIILPNSSKEDASKLGMLLCEKISELNIQHPNSVTQTVSISVGMVACVPVQSTTSITLIEQADKALYAAKNAGRNRCVVFF